MNEVKNEEQKLFLCKRTRLATYLVEQGFELESIEPESVSSTFNIYRFVASPELYAAVLDYNSGKGGDRE